MRYVFVSDIHGQFDKLIAALKKVDFNQETDTLVSLGDPFDRGDQNLEVLKFLMELPHKILVWGNHDLRLRELMLGQDVVGMHDYQNGLLATFKDLTGLKKITSINDGIFYLNEFTQCADAKNLLYNYFSSCFFAVEFSDLIATHAWVPTLIDKQKTYIDKWGTLMGEILYKDDPDWRNANWWEWESATWSNVQVMCEQNLYPEKRLLIGHWHSWRLRYFFELGGIPKELPKHLDCSSYNYENKLIAIDGCSNLAEGVVNTFVYETNEEPQLIDAKIGL